MIVSISIIIPIHKTEAELTSLLKNLQNTPKEITQTIIIGENAATQYNTVKTQTISTNISGRAHNLNAGAKHATGEFLWFLHADSILDKNTTSNLIKNIKKHPNNLHYCNLKFSNSNFLMKLNTIGVFFRSNILGIPFGDQAFCIKRSLFHQLGGFCESTPYGEDHLFIWKAKQNNIKITSIKAYLYTSSRKYRKYGLRSWIKTTLLHQYLWLKQALPEYFKFIKKKIL